MSGAGDVISGNGSNGVYIVNSDTTENHVTGDVIGLNPSQSTQMPNRANGVYIGGGATYNIIGGSNIDNVISGNDGDGVLITDSGTNSNVVQGNDIGTNFQYASGLGNGGDGVQITGGSSSNEVFSDDIEYNDVDGVEVDAGSMHTQIEYDAIEYNQIGVYMASGSSLTTIAYSTIENNYGMAIQDDGTGNTYNDKDTIQGTVGS